MHPIQLILADCFYVESDLNSLLYGEWYHQADVGLVEKIGILIGNIEGNWKLSILMVADIFLLKGKEMGPVNLRAI
jgi:hypothetical protein